MVLIVSIFFTLTFIELVSAAEEVSVLQQRIYFSAFCIHILSMYILGLLHEHESQLSPLRFGVVIVLLLLLCALTFAGLIYHQAELVSACNIVFVLIIAMEYLAKRQLVFSFKESERRTEEWVKKLKMKSIMLFKFELLVEICLYFMPIAIMTSILNLIAH